MLNSALPGIDSSRYPREEFTLVRSAFTVSERATRYASFERTGRTIPLVPKHRSDILRLLLFFEEYMLFCEVLDVLELTLAVTPLFRQIRDLPRAASKLANLYGELAGKSGEEVEVIDPELAVHGTAKPTRRLRA